MATETTAHPTARLHDLGQSVWLDNITRGLLTSGTLRRYIEDWSVTGLTSNPTIFDHAIEHAHSYDDAIRQKSGDGTSGEQLFFELAIEDLRQAATLTKAGVDVAALGDQLQREGAQSLDDSWNKLLRSLASKSSPRANPGRSATASS